MSKSTLKSPRSLKKYWDALNIIDEQHWVAVQNLEQELKADFGKKYEFIWVDGSVVGIGTEDRSTKLIHRS